MRIDILNISPSEREAYQKFAIALLECLPHPPEQLPSHAMQKRPRGRPKGTTKAAIAAGRKNLEWHNGGWRVEVVRNGVRYRRSVPHRKMTERRRNTFLRHLAETGSFSKAAEQTDGTIGTSRSYKVLAAKDHIFARAVEDALEAYSDKVAAVLREEFFDGTTVPIVSGGQIVLDKSGEEVWIRKRDPKIVLALSKKHDFGLREIKTIVNVDGTNANPDDPEIRLRSSDLWRLDAADATQLTRILRLIHDNRREDMADITPRREADDAIEAEFNDVPAIEFNEETQSYKKDSDHEL